MTISRIERREVPTVLSDAGWAELHPVFRRVYAARGVHRADDISPGLGALERPEQLGGLSAACELLCDAINQRQRILVVGDFDCDGATGTAVAVRGLRMLGASNVDFEVPHRMLHGYGLSAALVADLPRPLPDLLITVDSGIACIDGVAAARAGGCKVIVTDHHLPGALVPEADAIVNPCLFRCASCARETNSGHPCPHFQTAARSMESLRHLAGVGVMFYLLLALRAHLREQGRFDDDAVREPDLAQLLDLVAVGTVADMVPLDRNNRVLVAAGLRRLRAGRCQPGVAALAQVAGRSLAALSSTDIGFSIGPRLNAAGRLEDMRVGIACLLSDDPVEALELAQLLDGINRERRELQSRMLDDAGALLAGISSTLDGGDASGVVVYDASWHPGVVGLVASRLKDQLHRPVVALAPADENQPGGLWRGSARSVPGFHVRDALAEVARRQPDLLDRYGGHAMAAGLSIAADHIASFSETFAAVVDEWLTEDQKRSVLLSDGELSPVDFNRELAEQLRDGGPWGQGFPEPLFDNCFEVDSWRVVGERHLKLALRLADAPAAGKPINAIAFGAWTGTAPESRLRLAYSLGTDDFRDRHDIQLIVRHIEAVD